MSFCTKTLRTWINGEKGLLQLNSIERDSEVTYFMLSNTRM